MISDPFSEILRFTRAESLVTGGFTAGGPWALGFPAPDKIKFFAVVKGSCWVRIDGEKEPICLKQGDVGLLTAHRSFVLSSDLSTEPISAMEVFRGGVNSTTQLGNGQEFHYLGGHVLLEPASQELLAGALPSWIHVRATSPQALAFRWLLDLLVQEQASSLPGASLASEQLAQLLFIQILRAHLTGSQDLPAGWFRALADEKIAPAIRSIHAAPSRAWGLEELARTAAMSRTMFAVRFKAVLGVTPVSYLTAWRMRLAERALREEDISVSGLAQSLGYTSESAFSNAFKRATGTSPKRFRNSAHIVRRK